MNRCTYLCLAEASGRSAFEVSDCQNAVIPRETVGVTSRSRGKSFCCFSTVSSMTLSRAVHRVHRSEFEVLESHLPLSEFTIAWIIVVCFSFTVSKTLSYKSLLGIDVVIRVIDLFTVRLCASRDRVFSREVRKSTVLVGRKVNRASWWACPVKYRVQIRYADQGGG